MTTTTLPALGQTCTVGSGKTRWEVIRHANDGTLHLSKVGGDGYTNRWARPEELTNLQPRTLTNTLGAVLDARTAAAEAAQNLCDHVKRHAKPAKLSELQGAVVVTSNRYIRLYTGHLTEMEGTES
jgi:hypothetical protein